RGTERVRSRRGGERRGARLGLDGRAALPRAAGAPGRHARHERRGAGRAGYARLDDRRGQDRRAEADDGQAESPAMNGVHDMGGMQNTGPVVPEANEPVFHAAWEARVLALSLATGFLGKWNIDMGRYELEQMSPAQYLASSYYERWLWRLERFVVEKGLVTPREAPTHPAQAA